MVTSNAKLPDSTAPMKVRKPTKEELDVIAKKQYYVFKIFTEEGDR